MQRNSETSESSSDDSDAIDEQKDIFHEASPKLVETPRDTPKRANPLDVPVVSMKKLNRFVTISKYFIKIIVFYRF
jgi:hypothetical protein